jgi:hypothetical protein
MTRIPRKVREEAAMICRRAADRIERTGWKQGSDQPHEHERALPCCLMIALNHATDDLAFPDRSNAWRIAKQAVLDRVRPPGGLLSEWNDRPGRTVSEVLAALNEAASDLEHTP